MSSVIANPTIELVPLRQLKPAPYNPRAIDPASLAALEHSLKRFGYIEPIVWNRRTGFVVGGHQRLKILRSHRATEAHVVVVDLDDVEERALNVALNSPKLAGEFTAALDPLLDQIAASRRDLFDELRLGELRSEILASVYRTDPDEIPPPPATPITKVGDRITLGAHRVVCGDAADPVVVGRVLSAHDRDVIERVDLMVTDPPYGIAYGEKTRSGGRTAHRDIANDARDDYRAWFQTWMAPIPWAEYAAFYVFMSSQEMPALRGAIDDLRWKWHDTLIWLKSRAVLSRKDYNQRYEAIAFGEIERDRAPEVGSEIVYGWPDRHRFYGSHSRTNVLEYDTPPKNDLHPTMKPVALVEQLILDGSASGAIVYSPFGGSGTELIAAERTGRKARLIEIDPAYVDVIVARWEAHTGLSAERD